MSDREALSSALRMLRESEEKVCALRAELADANARSMSTAMMLGEQVKARAEAESTLAAWRPVVEAAVRVESAIETFANDEHLSVSFATWPEITKRKWFRLLEPFQGEAVAQAMERVEAGLLPPAHVPAREEGRKP